VTLGRKEGGGEERKGGGGENRDHVGGVPASREGCAFNPFSLLKYCY